MNHYVALSGNHLASNLDADAAQRIYEALADRLGLAEHCELGDENGTLHETTRTLHDVVETTDHTLAATG